MTDIRLRKNDFKELYDIVKSPICDFDCGKICSKKNEGVPVCCEVNVVLPVLHKEEYEYLSEHTELWEKFEPESKSDRELVEDCSYDDVVATCKGHKDCERDYRSFVCRTFPFYPYIDETGVFKGLTYNYDFEGKCIMVGKAELVSPDCVKELIQAWNYIFERDEEEFEGYYAISRDMEDNRKKKRKALDLLCTEGVKKI